jgi:hypothetical protein
LGLCFSVGHVSALVMWFSWFLMSFCSLSSPVAILYFEFFFLRVGWMFCGSHFACF